MAKKVTINNLDTAIEGILEEYGQEVQQNLGDIIQKTGRAGVQALKSESREKFGTTSKRKKKYADTWTMTTKKERIRTGVTIYNTQPGLPHLLENGHVSRNGTGRTFGFVDGREHIKAVERKLENLITQEVLKL